MIELTLTGINTDTLAIKLGIATANIPIAGLSVGGHEDIDSGVYYGWAGLNVDHEGTILPMPSSTSSTSTTSASQASTPASALHIYPTVLSIGYNPFYKNTVRSVEIHILHTFPKDFYGAHLNLLILGFIRPEYDYVSKEALVEDIRTDIEVGRRSLERSGYKRWREDEYLSLSPVTQEGGVNGVEVGDVAS